MSAPLPPPPRRHRRRKRPFIVRHAWASLVVVIAVGVAGTWFLGRVAARPRYENLPGYITAAGVVDQEYARFHGQALNNPDVERDFTLATQRMQVRDYGGAVGLLESAAKQAALPVIFNNLGVLYAALNDRARAINAFRDALARDIEYQPVRFNLKRLKGFTAASADPVTREIELNNTNMLANIIAPGTPVEAEINESVNDVDCFRFSAPQAPRDMLSIEIQPRSETLAPAVKIYDADSRLTDWRKESRTPGEPLILKIAPPPNSTLYVDVNGYAGTGGPYVLIVRPLKAFDAYEPNDTIMAAHRVPVGQSIDANIMDAQDTDYYSFVAPRTGSLAFNIRNRSDTLIPGLTTFAPDMRTSGFGPDIRTPGANLRYVMDVQEGQIYFVQVWSQANSAGAYTLTIE